MLLSKLFWLTAPAAGLHPYATPTNGAFPRKETQVAEDFLFQKTIALHARNVAPLTFWTLQRNSAGAKHKALSLYAFDHGIGSSSKACGKCKNRLISGSGRTALANRVILGLLSGTNRYSAALFGHAPASLGFSAAIFCA